MTPLQFIRVKVLDLSQGELATLCDVTPMTVSRWERGERRPPLDDLQRILAAEAARRSLPWEDSWLFRLPACPECPTLDGTPDEPGTVCPGGCARLVAQCARIRAGGGGGDHGAGVGACPVTVTGNGGFRVPVTSDRQEAA